MRHGGGGSVLKVVSGTLVRADNQAPRREGCVREQARVGQGDNGVQSLAHGERHLGKGGGSWPAFQRPIRVMGFWQRGHRGAVEGAGVVD